LEENASYINLKEIKSNTISGFLWNSIDQGGNYVIHFLFGILTVRILDPEDYGLFGLISIFIALSVVFIDSGLGTVLIQRKNTNNSDFDTVFWFNVVVGIILFLIFFLLAPLISKFYNEPKIINLIRVISLLFLLISLSSTFNTFLTKNLEFKKLALINLSNSFFFVTTTLTYAILGFKYWSLVYGYISAGIITLILNFLFSSWKPKLYFSIGKFKNMYKDSIYLFIQNIINTFTNNLNKVIIGKRFNTITLGFYDRSNQLELYFSKTFGLIINKTILPNLIELNDNNNLLRNSFKIILNIITFISFFIASLLFINSKEIIIILFTEKWLLSAKYFNILMISAGFYPLIYLYRNILLIKNQNRTLLIIELRNFIIYLILIISASFYSVELILWAQNLYVLILMIFYSNNIKKTIQLNYIEQINVFLKSIYIIFISVALCLILKNFLNFNVFLNLIIISIIFIFLVIIFSEILKNQAYLEIKQILINYLNAIFKLNLKL